MGWGTRITLFYGSFVAFMLFMVVMAVQQDFDLVADNYYEQEIAYQDRIDQMNNANSDYQK
ncbi:MAG: FixH family protein [Flavobacteriales bacterium]|nr:FixH family protein [Flavobacteriales bacterium]